MENRKNRQGTPKKIKKWFRIGRFFAGARFIGESDMKKKIVIEYVGIDTVIPYENNPRINDQAVDAVANSINEFGFKVPIVVDKKNVIITGHTRLKAAQKLGLKQVPVIRAEDLTQKQVKAFRIADNSTGELAQWDLDKLSIELDGLAYDFSDFGLDYTLPEIPDADFDFDDGYYGDERERTNKAYHLDGVDFTQMSQDFWQMPVIEATGYIPDRLIGFNYAKTSTDKDCGIHFYVDDYQFERVWNYPDRYIDTLSEYQCVLSPDFSLYMDMPMPMKIWNVYRSRFIGQYYQRQGMIVIPTMSWAEPETYEFCFKGIPKGSVVSVSTVGVKQDKIALGVWENGMVEMINQIEPKAILVYGGKLEFDYQGIDVKYFENEVTKRWKEG